jgi:hypothetical protein
MTTAKFDDWNLRLLKRDEVVVVTYLGEEMKRISVNKLLDDGMRKFPKPLYKLIAPDLKHANVYDKFMGRLFDEYDPDV